MSCIVKIDVEQMEDLASAKSAASVSALDELYYGKPVRRHVREFALLFALLFLGVASYQLLYHIQRIALISGCCAAGAVCILLGYRYVRVLHPVWKAWMWFSEILGTIVTFVILFSLWILAMIPMALIMKAVGKRVMDLSYKTSAESYWEVREEGKNDFKLLKKQA